MDLNLVSFVNQEKTAVTSTPYPGPSARPHGQTGELTGGLNRGKQLAV